jgi:hypothetical protein
VGRRGWLAAALVSAVIAGPLLAVLLPRESDTSGGPTPVLVATQTIPASAQVFPVGEVRREFRRQGLRLRELPNGGTEPRVFVSPHAGPVFNVDIYGTVGAAAAAEDLIFVLRPANYQIRGQLMTRRKANVVVVLEQGRLVVRKRVNAALTGLG